MADSSLATGKALRRSLDCLDSRASKEKTVRIPYVFQLMQIVVPALVALAVVALGQAFSAYRDRENKRREQRIAYLVSAFRALSKASHHPRLYEVAEDVEQAVSDIQLFGTPRQVELVRAFATQLATAKEAELDSLLSELRDSLRRELGRGRVTGNMPMVADRQEDRPVRKQSC
jgi:hypothetical protein